MNLTWGVLSRSEIHDPLGLVKVGGCAWGGNVGKVSSGLFGSFAVFADAVSPATSLAISKTWGLGGQR
jgi:hypothetical protein